MFKFNLKRCLIILLVVFSLGFYFGVYDSYWEKIEQNKKKEENNKDNIVQKIEKDKKIEVDFLEVIDGDTIKVIYQGKRKSVRVLGINTPEKKNPFRPQECFGEEASQKAKEIFKNVKKVKIEFDETQSKFDKHGRILAYVYLPNGEDFGLKMIKDGYAYEYTYKGRWYKHQKEYKEAEKFARKNKLGLWSENTCNGKRSEVK